MEKLYTLQETADILRLKHGTVRMKIYSGELGHYKYPRVIRISESHIKAFLKSMENGAVKARS